MSAAPISRISTRLCSVASLLMLSALPASATAVDTELMLLVDAQTYSQSDFNLILDSVARTFEDQSFQDAVINGQTGKMAASVWLFNLSGEQVGLPWSELTNVQDMVNFAQGVRSISYPNSGGNVSYASALTTAANQLATNTFTGSTRQITLIDDATGFWAADPAGTLAARNTALASGVDVINAIAFDAQWQEATVTGFYNNNVVSPNGNVSVVATPQGGPKSAAQIDAIVTSVTGNLMTPTVTATKAVNAVPESSSLALLAFGSLLVIRRRR